MQLSCMAMNYQERADELSSTTQVFFACGIQAT